MTFFQKVSITNDEIEIILDECSDFSAFLQRMIKKSNMSQAALADATGISKPTMCRLCGNSYNGKPNFISLNRIQAICVYFRIYGETRRRVFYLAFEIFEIWDEIDEKKLGIIEANILLDDKGYPLLGE